MLRGVVVRNEWGVEGGVEIYGGFVFLSSGSLEGLGMLKGREVRRLVGGLLESRYRWRNERIYVHWYKELRVA